MFDIFSSSRLIYKNLESPKSSSLESKDKPASFPKQVIYAPRSTASREGEKNLETKIL